MTAALKRCSPRFYGVGKLFRVFRVSVFPCFRGASRGFVSSALLCLVGFLALAGAWWWRVRVLHAKPTLAQEESWEHVKEQYPLPSDTGDLSETLGELSNLVASANPFSADRRNVALTTQEGQSEAAPQVPAPAPTEWVYKGRIDLGNRQRAILEDAKTRKTHFLEVGQEVAGFKVLDIAENRVVLSDVKTGKEVAIPLASKQPGP